MFGQIFGCLKSGSALRHGLRPAPLFLLLVSIFAHSSSAQAKPLRVSAAHSTQPESTSTQTTADVTLLAPSESLQREIAGGKKQSYQIELSEGQYADIEIDSLRLKAAVTVFDTRGEAVARYDINQNSRTHQGIEIVAEATGRYRLEVTDKSTDAAQTYTIQFTAPHAASDQELHTYQARRLHFRAAALIDAAKYNEALALEEKALGLREHAHRWRSRAPPLSLQA